MQRLLFVVIIAITVIGLPLLSLSDTAISSDDTSILNSEVISSVSKIANSSAITATTITMTGVLDE